jgi:hypothetical protein
MDDPELERLENELSQQPVPDLKRLKGRVLSAVRCELAETDGGLEQMTPAPGPSLARRAAKEKKMTPIAVPLSQPFEQDRYWPKSVAAAVLAVVCAGLFWLATPPQRSAAPLPGKDLAGDTPPKDDPPPKPETPDVKPPADEKKINELVKMLGSDNYQEREDASKSLKAIGQPAKAALEKELASSKDEEVLSRVSTLLELLKPHLTTLAQLSAAEREAVELPIEDLAEGAESGMFSTYANENYSIVDIFNIRVLSKNGAGVRGKTSALIYINPAMQRSGSYWSEISMSLANGVSTIITPEVECAISNGVLEIGGQKVKFEKRPKVVFLDDKGKLEKLYDFNKEENVPKIIDMLAQ